MFRRIEKASVIKMLGLVGAVAAGLGLILNGQYVEGVGVIAASFSSSSALSGG